MSPADDPQIRLRARHLPPGLEIAVLNAVPHAAAILDHGGQVVAVNQAWRALADKGDIPAFDLAAGGDRACDCDETCELSVTASDSLVEVISGIRQTISATATCATGFVRHAFRVDVSALQLGGRRGALIICVDISDYLTMPLTQANERVACHA